MMFSFAALGLPGRLMISVRLRMPAEGGSVKIQRRLGVIYFRRQQRHPAQLVSCGHRTMKRGSDQIYIDHFLLIICFEFIALIES